MIRKTKLIQLTRYTKDKNNNPLVSQKTGRPYTRLVINVEGYDKSLSGFENADTKDWKEGDMITIDVTENGQYLNFSVPKKEELKSSELEKRVEDLERKVRILEGFVATSEPVEKPDYGEADPEDIPF